MKLVSIDIETTGLNPVVDKILSIGCVICDTTNKNDFKFLEIRNFCNIDNLIISDVVKNMNKELLDDLNYLNSNNNYLNKRDFYIAKNYYVESDITQVLKEFFEKNGIDPKRVNVCGKNFATFDKLFLERLPNFKEIIRFRQRIIDPAILYVDWENDESLPDLQTCIERSNLEELKGKIVQHTALDDAIVTLKLVLNKI